MTVVQVCTDLEYFSEAKVVLNENSLLRDEYSNTEQQVKVTTRSTCPQHLDTHTHTHTHTYMDCELNKIVSYCKQIARQDSTSVKLVSVVMSSSSMP